MQGWRGFATGMRRSGKKWCRFTEETCRLRIRQTRLRPYVYRAGKKSAQLESRTHGLILVGPDIDVNYPYAVRKTRSDKREVEPPFAFGKTQISSATGRRRGGEGDREDDTQRASRDSRDARGNVAIRAWQATCIENDIGILPTPRTTIGEDYGHRPEHHHPA